MQTPKTRTGSESCRNTGRVVRQLKTSSSSSQTSITTPKTTSPKIIPRSHVPTEKKRVVELETQVTQLEEALRLVKEQLILSESWKKQANLDAQESREELLAMALRLEESQKLLPHSSSHDVVPELEDEENDEAWKSKLEKIQKPNSNDSAALTAALLEINQLKVKLDTITESEATQSKQAESAYKEIHILKENMEEMKKQLEDCKSSECMAQAVASKTLLQLETAKKTMESLKFTSDEYNAIVLELNQSRVRVSSLERIIDSMKRKEQEPESEEVIALKSELGKLKSRQTMEITAELKKSRADIEELQANLMDKETEFQCILEKNQDLNAKLTNLIAGNQENESKQDFNRLETEVCKKSDENEKLKLEIKKTNVVMEALKQDHNSLKTKMVNLETESCEKLDENKILKLEIKKTNAVMETVEQDYNGLKSKTMNLETELHEKLDENEKLKLEIKKMEGVMTEVKTSKGEMEEELRRLKLQMSQWRKAAEAAADMFSEEKGDNNGGMAVDRRWSMGHYSPRKKMNMSSPCSVDIIDDDDDDDDEFLKRKNGNMLQRIGVLWKKPQNK